MKRETLTVVLVGAFQVVSMAYLYSIDNRLGRIEAVLFTRPAVVAQIGR